MTEALRRVVAEIESLLQDELNRRWDELLESPKSVAMLDRMAEGAMRDAREGRVKDLRF